MTTLQIILGCLLFDLLQLLFWIQSMRLAKREDWIGINRAESPTQ